MLRASLLVLCACACALAAPGAEPLRLAGPLPALSEYSGGAEESMTLYHLPVGVPEAERIAALEAPAWPGAWRPRPTKPRPEGPEPTRPIPEGPEPTRPGPEKPEPTRPGSEGPEPTRPGPEGPRPTEQPSSPASEAPEQTEQTNVPTDEDGPGVMIVGGLASFRGEHPFMAGLVISLTTGETSVCGGSLVSPARVLTAAACYWDGYSQAYAMLVVLGSVTLFSGGTRVSASTIAVHSSYSPATIHYNLAVLTVPYQYTTAYVKPIALATSGEHVGTRAEAIGFGRTSDTAAITSAASMRDVFVDVISNAVCQQYYGTQVSAAEMCSSGVGGRNPCGGDQGGPLIIYSSAGNDLLLGVFTFGSSAGCSAGAPAGYQRVAYYYPWILNQL